MNATNLDRDRLRSLAVVLMAVADRQPAQWSDDNGQTWKPLEDAFVWRAIREQWRVRVKPAGKRLVKPHELPYSVAIRNPKSKIIPATSYISTQLDIAMCASDGFEWSTDGVTWNSFEVDL